MCKERDRPVVPTAVLNERHEAALCRSEQSLISDAMLDAGVAALCETLILEHSDDREGIVIHIFESMHRVMEIEREGCRSGSSTHSGSGNS